MNRKTCKTPTCISDVWRNGIFTYSDYCWEHDPVVIEVKEKIAKSGKAIK